MNEEEKKIVEHLKKTSKDRIIPLDDEILIAINLIEKLQKENESLKKDIYILSDVPQWLKYYWVGRKERDNEWIQKIKEEIGKLEEMNVDGEIFTTAVNFAILTLQELIEEREEK